MYRLVAAIAVVALALAACGSSSSGSATPDPTVAFCPALDTYSKSLTKLQALVATSSVAQYPAAVADAKTALAAVKLVAGPLAGAQLNDLQTAQVQLESAAGALPSGTTPEQAATALQAPLQTVTAQAISTYNAICNAHPTPSSAS